MSSRRLLRVVVWSTGWVGSIAVRTVHERPDLELAGVWVHSPEKVGRDAGEIVGCPKIGVLATHDADALIASRPDCVVYAASGPTRGAGAIPDYVRFLEAGINVVTTTSTDLIFPQSCDSAIRAKLESVAKAGKASLYASGIFPGFASDQLALVLSTLSKSIRTVRVTEVSLCDHYPDAAAMRDGMGFGRPLEFKPALGMPGVIDRSWRSSIHLIAAGLGVEVEDVRGELKRELTQRSLETAFGVVEAGTCGAVLTRAAGVVNGREAIVIEHIYRLARDVAPGWPSSDHDATYNVELEGEPDIRCSMTTGDAAGYGAGGAAMVATAMRVVNAVPYVVAAQPGLLSSLDLPITVPQGCLV